MRLSIFQSSVGTKNMQNICFNIKLFAMILASLNLVACAHAQPSHTPSWVEPVDQTEQYKVFFEKIKRLIDEDRLGDPLYTETALGLEIRGARPRTYETKPAKFPPGLIAYYEDHAAANPPVFKYRSRKLDFPQLNIAACIRYEFLVSIYGKGFRTPPYGQPHINWSPGTIPQQPVGTYAGMNGIFKQVRSNPLTEKAFGFDFNGCATGMTINLARE
jgi:hypothetical protein